MKKIMAGMLSACIAFGPVTTPVFAAGKDVMLISSAESEEAESMKTVLLKVKEKITVPEELTEFNYRLSYSGGNYSKNKYWNFEWRDKEYKKNLKVSSDDSGNITGYSMYDSSASASKPTYLKEELIEKATDFIKNIAPELSENIVLVDSEFTGVYYGTYSYTFERIENGIRMPDNKVTVSVNYETGEIRSFNSVWDFDVEIPGPETNITIENAREKIGEKVNMQLKYMNKTDKEDGKNKVKAYLVYVPDKSYTAVDAKTGEIYDTRNEYYDMSELNESVKQMATMDSAYGANRAESELSVEELNKINEMKNLITKDEAISAVTSKTDVLLLDDASKAVDARLSQKYNYEEEENDGYVWNLNFSDPRETNYETGDTYRAYTNVTVDAENGKILSFYSSVKDYYDPKSKEWKDAEVKYTSEECKETFEKFVKSIEKEKFSNTVLSDIKDTAYLLKYINEEPVYGGYSYNYARVNEGIEYSYDGISGKVDGVTGKIYSYNVDWTENIEFESPQNAMSAKDAYKAYSEKDGFELVYEINNKHYIDNNPEKDKYYDYSDLYVLEKEARLVYRTNINPAYISPFTGEQLNYSGEVYEDVNDKVYTDISGFWGERSIKLITDMGYVFKGDKFLPEKNITKDEWFKLLQIARSYTNEEEYEELNKLTKSDAVKMMIKNAGFEKVAKLSGIYKSSFADANEIATEDIGYIALAEGFKLINGDDGNRFNPNKELTRIEAVCMALKLATVSR